VKKRFLNIPSFVEFIIISGLILFFTIVASSYAISVNSKKEPFVFRYPIEKINRIYDGDTFWADIDLGFDLKMVNVSIRVAGCDAYELKEDGGPAAKLLTEVFLSTGTLTLVTRGERDDFGRILATVEKDGKYLDDVLTGAKLVTGRFRNSDIVK